MSDNANKMRDRLVELIKEELCITTVFNGEFIEATANIEEVANHLLADGVFVAPMPMTDWLREELTEHINKRCFEEL